jgi:acyl-CoA reductase-like NAD-dependent aldehyde dehydrogenase
MHQDTLLHIAGEWRPSSTRATIPVVNPATEEIVGTVAHASRRDLQAAVEAAKSGFGMKRATMELGGHSPAIVFDDADIETAVTELSAAKHRNAGQVCVSPTRFLVERSIFAPFVDKFVEKAASIRVGDGLADGTMMGPLANRRRLDAMDELISDAVKLGGQVKLGGRRIGNKGYYFEPTGIRLYLLYQHCRSSRVGNRKRDGVRESYRAQPSRDPFWWH